MYIAIVHEHDLILFISISINSSPWSCNSHHSLTKNWIGIWKIREPAQILEVGKIFMESTEGNLFDLTKVSSC
jgi:hypothetical protein